MICQVLLMLFTLPAHLETLTFYNFGIFSICEKANGTSKKTSKQLDAQIYKNILDDMIELQKKILTPSHNQNYNKLKYLSFDVCDNTTELTAVMADILLDTQYAVSYPNTRFQQSIVAFIYTYLPDQMKSLVLEVFSFTNIYVHFFEMIKLPDATLQSTRFKWYSWDLLRIVNKFQWQDIFLVSVAEENDLFPYHVYYNASIQELTTNQK